MKKRGSPVYFQHSIRQQTVNNFPRQFLHFMRSGLLISQKQVKRTKSSPLFNGYCRYFRFQFRREIIMTMQSIPPAGYGWLHHGCAYIRIYIFDFQYTSLYGDRHFCKLAGKGWNCQKISRFRNLSFGCSYSQFTSRKEILL